jgi:hypothetical protein
VSVVERVVDLMAEMDAAGVVGAITWWLPEPAEPERETPNDSAPPPQSDRRIP